MTIWVRDNNTVEIACLEWAYAGPAINDLATTDITCKLTGFSRYLDNFFAGYGSLDPFWRPRLEFYRFYALCLMLAFDQHPPLPRQLLVKRIEWYARQNSFLQINRVG